ncbi:survival motor neuron protein 1-like isoform X2 [Sardina pilchardus]|uniref:survival motor neuron protein 1-like isoform X2 n=1 Tax=Sardina pilchardus TaxID=27697 RepID=UPI002E160C73
MADCSDTVVFRRDDAGRGGPVSFAEDDSALVKAYDNAVRSFRVQTSGEDQGEDRSDGKQADAAASAPLQANTTHKLASVSKAWVLGSRCRAVWSEDGLEYPGVIVSVDGERCRVQFEGYGNEEDVDLSALLPAIPEQPWRGRRWSLGSHCRAVWSEDGLVYPGVVVWMKGERCRVRFDVYNNEEDMELSALLPPEDTEDETDTQDQEETPGDGSSGSSSSDWRRKDGHAKRPKSPEKSRHGHSSGKQHSEEAGKKPPRRGEAAPPPPFPFMPPPGMPPMGLPDLSMFPPPPPPSFTWPAGKAGALGGDSPEDEMASLSSMLLSWYLCGYHTGYYMGAQQASAGPLDTKKKKRVNGMESALKMEE